MAIKNIKMILDFIALQVGHEKYNVAHASHTIKREIFDDIKIRHGIYD